MKTAIYILLLATLFQGCKEEIVLTEQTIPDEILYIENSRIPYTGKCIIYYQKTNQIHYTFNYEKGILNGPFEGFYKNGKIQFKGNYSDGELAGKFLKYNESGAIVLNYQIQDIVAN